MEEKFLLETFKELNEHIRGVDNKSLTVTGAFLGLFSVLLAYNQNLNVGVITCSESNWNSVVFQGIFLIIGTVVVLLQSWYRYWKEHYIETCFKIRKNLTNLSPDCELLPYWLRSSPNRPIISVENLLKYTTYIVNGFMVISISMNAIVILKLWYFKVPLVSLAIVAYFFSVSSLDRQISKEKRLFA